MVHEGRVPYHEHQELEVDADVKRALVRALEDRNAEVDAAIAAGITAELRRRHIRFDDRRLLLLYVVNILVFAVLFGLLRSEQRESDRARASFERATVATCRVGAENAQSLDVLIDRIVQAVQASPMLPRAEKEQRISLYLSGRPEIPTCPSAPIR